LLEPFDDCVESLAGVQLYPAVTAVGNVPDAPKGDLVVDLQGPAVLRLHTSYSVPYRCGGTGDALTGTTTFTMTHTGRIVRRDENVIGSTVGYSTSGSCASTCSPGDSFHFTSFWAFAEGEVFDVNRNPGPIANKAGCIVTNGHTIAIKYNGGDTSQIGKFNAGTIALQNLTPSSQSWGASVPAQMAESQLAFVFGIEPADCTAAIEMLIDPPLEVNGELVVAEQAIYLATQKVYRDTITITAPMGQKNGFSLMINLGGSKHARVRINGNDTDYYFVELDGEFPVFFFGPGLLSTDTLTIEAF
jgi:hypothetical protein